MLNIGDFLAGREKICVVGLGYVGLPLAVLFSRQFRMVGFDISRERINELAEGYDKTNELDREAILGSNVDFSADATRLAECKVIVVTVPTPIDEHNMPDLRPIRSASRTVGKNMAAGTLIVYESTVYPGLTEEECIPLLEGESGLKWKVDFNVGYSPERVNPGDREHTIDKIKKVVAGDTADTGVFLSDLYGSVITAGIHKAPNIKTAEAAKVIENTQRDLNIALMNELSLIFNKMGVDTREVLDAASTKWNFLRFEPGLVGGHCIGVDPYYLTFKAQSMGYRPEVILAGRKINDGMGKYVAENTVKGLLKAGKSVRGCRVLILGATFKENIPDIRNTKVVDIFRELKEYGIDVSIYDPYADPEEVRREYSIDLIGDPGQNVPYSAIIVAVKHRRFLEEFDLPKYRNYCEGTNPVLIDIKGIYEGKEAAKNGFIYWRL